MCLSRTISTQTSQTFFRNMTADCGKIAIRFIKTLEKGIIISVIYGRIHASGLWSATFYNVYTSLQMECQALKQERIKHKYITN